jgi:hypothetical protein
LVRASGIRREDGRCRRDLDTVETASYSAAAVSAKSRVIRAMSSVSAGG